MGWEKELGPELDAIADALLVDHAQALKRFMLSVDMGMIELHRRDAISALPDHASFTERLAAYASDWVYSAFPSRDSSTTLPDPLQRQILVLAVKFDGKLIDHIDQLDDGICLEAVRQCGRALRFVPQKYRTEALLMEAVIQDGLALGLIRPEQQSEALRLTAVKGNCLALSHIPKDQQSPEVLQAAIENGAEVGNRGGVMASE